MTQTEPHLTPIDGGYHIKDLPDGTCVDVMRMLFNYRVVLSERGRYGGEERAHVGYIKGFCFFGHGVDANGVPRTMESALFAAIASAYLWDGTGEPIGYDKRVGA